MATFEFSLIVEGADPAADDFADRFYDAGCDDALVSHQGGRTIIDFTRASTSREEAVASATRDVEAAGARVISVEITAQYREQWTQIAFDQDDKIYVGRLEGISDIVGFHGETLNEAEAAFHDAVDDYMQTCAQVGKEPERPQPQS